MNRFFALILIVAAALPGGCATEADYRQPPVVAVPPALTLAQIKEMTARGVSDETILSALRASRAVYRLTSKDVMELQEAKVSPAVIDYLLITQQYPPQPPPVPYRYYYYYPPPWPYWYYGGHFGFHHHWHHGGHHGGHHH
jgi:hypothetical protein